MTAWKIYVRDLNYKRIGEVSDFQKLEAILKFNDVGTWILDINQASREALMLTVPGHGIQIINDDTGDQLMSGPVAGRHFASKDGKETITVSGVDDNYWLKARLSHPSPAESFPPYEVQANHAVTGQCSTVLRTYVSANLGTAANSERKIANVTLPTDPLLGATVKGSVRWTNLLEDLQELATVGRNNSGDIGFRLTQVGTNLEFQVYQTSDKTTTAKFSRELGNLAGYEFDTTAPETTYVYVAGQGEGTARTIKEGQNSGERLTWGRREEFADRRDTNDDTELGQKVTEVLEEHHEKTGLVIHPIDTEQLRFGVDYGMGDKVSVAVFETLKEQLPDAVAKQIRVSANFEGAVVKDVIRQVKVTLTPEKSRVEPVVGTENAEHPDAMRLAREFRRLRMRTLNMETI
ncbi:siphovirus ReqiPepy6 Gp37-like family protein [Saccharopolyspora mangrovi]|uniref:Siphovirus ReqiPepy6 Gp37-like family protein n=1 Tax=Saccharopolyspora mangrovi TaxID=3082379 RepID=A0ABU6A7C7_9PSEU|nr:siphovirus ReqiPepy6 Gp37-like family protein [Saccharopolyspora sp. S2-29]MEB3367423.1 siphovirus ReqiPepy6 Gp37-like family protein [Saccharopolyspora sp. S2-29]